MAGKKILLVEYDPRVLKETKNILLKAGYTVYEASDGLSALSRFEEVKPDLVLMSPMLPKLHGFDVCQKLKTDIKSKSTPVIIITDVYKGKRYRTEAIHKYGADEYIEKPISDDNLTKIIDEYINKASKIKEYPKQDTEKIRKEAEVISQQESTISIPISATPLIEEIKTGEKEKIETPSKKAVQQAKKIELDSDIEKKLQDTLSGLQIGTPSKAKVKFEEPKEKEAISSIGVKKEEKAAQEKEIRLIPEEKSAKPPEKEPAEEVFTSEELFKDVIQSVEEEIKEEEPKEIKEIPSVEIKEKELRLGKEKISKPVISDEALEKKLSDTLAGLSKELGLKPSKEKISSKVEKDVEVSEILSKAVEKEVGAKFIPSSQKMPSQKIEIKKEEVPPPTEVLKVLEEEVAKEGIIFGPYILLEKIATGGMAELFKAKKKGVEGFEKTLAIKKILPHLSDNEEFVKMFIDEAKLAAHLTHPNIVQIYDLGRINNAYYIAMEYVDGKDLRSILKKTRQLDRPMPIAIAIFIAARLCNALDYAHRFRNEEGTLMNIVHRDISPQNIIISYEGETKLVDFGIAKAAVKAHQTQIGALKGKLLYMSPEQASAKMVDKRSDIFALGIVLWEMIANKTLFYEKGDSEVSIIDKVREAIIPDIKKYRKNVPPELEAILSKALQKNPELRYQDASEMLSDLEKLLHKMNLQISQNLLSKYISALFSEDVNIIEDINKQLEPQVVETIVIEKEKKAEIVPEQISTKAPLIEEKAKIEKSPIITPKIELYGEDIYGKKEKSYLKYIIPPVVLIAAALLLIGTFREHPSPSVKADKGKSQQELIQENKITEPEFVSNEGAEKTIPTQKGAPKPSEIVKEEPSGEKQAAEIQPKEAPKKEEVLKGTEKPATTEAKEAGTESKIQEGPKEITTPPALPSEGEKNTGEKPVSPPQPVEPIKGEGIEGSKETKLPPSEEPKEPKLPPKEEIKEGDLVPIGPDVSMPEAIKKTLPSYPLAAKKVGIEGLVILQALISEKGDVIDIKPLRGNQILMDAAVEAVKNWKFKPATKNGIKVKIWYTITIPFKIK